MKQPRVITENERTQSGWQKAETALAAKLAKYREQLESTVTPPEKREALVWRIAEVNDILRLAIPDEKK